ncbi:hypothetical protein niasHT_019282 [Heterodera trifolii]|uniref:Uncharacterized protein n=1 Tax=Heterodera trifolii TaxID=157864 RepID=A0ABD2L9X5_9BILA
MLNKEEQAQLCAQSIDDLCITINSVADDQSKLAAATGAYNGLKKFIDQLPSLPSPPALADLSLDKEEDYPVSVLNKCSDLVRNVLSVSSFFRSGFGYHWLQRRLRNGSTTSLFFDVKKSSLVPFALLSCMERGGVLPAQPEQEKFLL